MDKHILAKKYLNGVIFKKFSSYKKAKKVFTDIGNTPWYLRIFYKTKFTNTEKLAIVLSTKEYLLEELEKKIQETKAVIEDLEINFTIKEFEFSGRNINIAINEYKNHLKHLLHIKNYYIHNINGLEKTLLKRTSPKATGLLSFYEDSEMYGFNSETFNLLESLKKDMDKTIAKIINEKNKEVKVSILNNDEKKKLSSFF